MTRDGNVQPPTTPSLFVVQPFGLSTADQPSGQPETLSLSIGVSMSVSTDGTTAQALAN